MKKIIFILTVALSLSACKKGEKCLVNGTWTVDKAYDDNYKKYYYFDASNKTTISFSKDAKMTIKIIGKPDVILDYTATDTEIFQNTNPNLGVKYNCKGNKLTIYGDITTCGLGCIGGQTGGQSSITTYLSK